MRVGRKVEREVLTPIVFYEQEIIPGGKCKVFYSGASHSPSVTKDEEGGCRGRGGLE